MVWIKSPNADLGDVAGDPKQTVANKAGMLRRSDFVSLLNQMKLFGARLQKKDIYSFIFLIEKYIKILEK